MKKTIYTLLAIVIFSCLPAKAYEYFTIYFSDGTKSEAFYATDVDSICYSKLSLDSIAYDDWQVQEIYTCDSIYRYPLALIDSLSFKDVDVNIVAEDIDRASGAVVPLFAQNISASELSQHLPAIRNIQGVKDAWIDGNALYIDIRDYGTITFAHPPVSNSENNSFILSSRHESNVNQNMSFTEQDYSTIGKVCIFNHMDKDESKGFDDARWVAGQIKEMYENMGITCDVKTPILPDFFVNQMFDYDQLFIITHGNFDKDTGTHWLATDKEILCIEDNKWFSHIDEFKDFLNKKAFYSSNKLRIFAHDEVRNGKNCMVFYVAVSEHLISSSKHKFQNPNAVVFNAACQSMKGDESNKYNMANAFINKGASCYLGYTDDNTCGRLGGFEFFRALLNGSCIGSSLNLMDDIFKKQDLYEYESYTGLFTEKKNSMFYELNNEYHPVLNGIVGNPNLGFLQPETLEADNSSDNNTKLIGRIKKIDSGEISYKEIVMDALDKGYKYGFQLSTNSDMSQAKDTMTVGNYDSRTFCMNWEAIIDESTLLPNTTYYYRAYMNDGYSNCYGEVKQFTTKGAYYVWNEKEKTVIFYYDNKMVERNDSCSEVNEIKGEYSSGLIPSNTTKVTIDSSFVHFFPISTANWFRGAEELTQIEGLQFLNTSYVTDMCGMFYECSSLMSLDVSSFNTINVTNMKWMFRHCSSLKSLDVSNFNTSNVTDMTCMFAKCESLTSLDVSHFNTDNVTKMINLFFDCSSLTSLDVSNFNTANVTDMSGMFGWCTSLTALNVSNFNTANVTNMALMFSVCSSLKSLDVSNFNTANVTDMSCMFVSCSSLTSLDLSNFNTENVTDMASMFMNCHSLTSLNTSSFNTSNVTDMSYMFSDCCSLTSIDVSNFNTANVMNMMCMFAACSSLTSLDLSNFNTANVTNMRHMFQSCKNLITIYAENWNLSTTTDSYGMFRGCDNLKGGKGTKIGNSLGENESQYYFCPDNGQAAHIDGGKEWPGLFTAK